MTDRDPLVVGSVLSLLTAATAVWLVASTGPQRSALAVTLVALAAGSVGLRLGRGEHRLVGWLCLTGATAGLLVALAQAWSTPVGRRLELYPGLLGLTLLAGGLAPLRRGQERRLVTAGTGLVLLSVVVSGIVKSTEATALLVAVVATVVAWDLGEQAVNLSAHVGTDARTWPTELIHGGASLAVGGLAVGAALLVSGVGVTDVSLTGLGLLLGATVVLTVALSN